MKETSNAHRILVRSRSAYRMKETSNAHRILVRKHFVKLSLAKSRKIQEDKIKMDIRSVDF
jgi:hypothetical protein